MKQMYKKQKDLAMLTGRQMAFMIHAYFRINDVQGRTRSMNDLLHIELANDILKQFNQA